MPSALERLCNRVNDWDLTWLGFARLRPKPEQDMSGRVVAILCLVNCPLLAGIGFTSSYLVLKNVNRPVPPFVSWLVAAVAAVLFVLMQSVLASAWNRRAARLRAGQSQ